MPHLCKEPESRRGIGVVDWELQPSLGGGKKKKHKFKHITKPKSKKQFSEVFTMFNVNLP